MTSQSSRTRSWKLVYAAQRRIQVRKSVAVSLKFVGAEWNSSRGSIGTTWPVRECRICQILVLTEAGKNFK